MIDDHDLQWGDILSMSVYAFQNESVLSLKKKTKKKSIRPFGDVTNDYTFYVQEIKNDHLMNQAQVLHMIYHYLLVHCPGAREEYVSGGNPVFKAKNDYFYYGPKN